MEKIEKNKLNPVYLMELKKALYNLNISKTDWLQFREMIRGLRLNKGEFLIQEGDQPNKIAFISAGIFRAFYLTEAGDEKTIVFREKGKPLSAYSSFIKQRVAKFSIQALTNGELLYVSIKDFETLLKKNPVWSQITSDYFMNLFIEKEKRERQLLSDNAETRYIQFQKEYPGLEDKISHYYIASYLGITNVSLSRIRTAHKAQEKGE